ncbi:hypothetical protein K4K59_010246 [Colletotrichum sp. SAR11_240]|nr:hypothetical protein K4K59_010246 [Colletotrichum sp. SAR11_240]
MSDPGTDNPTILSILSPQPPYLYEWDEEKSRRGQTSINPKLKKLRLPKIEIVDKDVFVKAGCDLLNLVKANNFQYNNKTFLDQASIQHYPPVPGNRSHFPQSEADGVLTDGRHNRDAVDEDSYETRQSRQHGESREISISSHATSIKFSSIEVSSFSTTTSRPAAIRERERDRLLNILRPDTSDRCPASRQIELAEALTALRLLLRNNGCEDLKVGWIEGRADLLYSTVDSGTTSVDGKQLAGPRALPLGIPDGLMRPHLAAEAKKFKYVTKAVEDIKRVADEESQSDGGMSTVRGARKNHRRRQYSENTSDLLRQGGGYMIYYRIMYCELFDTRSHIFMHAPGLKIDNQCTTPELWLQTLERAGPIQVALFEEKDLPLLPVARLGLRHLAREGTPWDVLA